jgi:phage terminase Nu1 subunit (DNA packaging protein)
MPAVTQSAFSLYRAMHRLWTDHILWTHQYIVAAVDERPEVEEAAGRLLKNQEDIGNAIAPLYGKDAGAQLTDLLKQHIMIAVDLIEAAKSGDKAKFGELDQTWTENAEEIAGFLSSANPNWPQRDVFDLLQLHLNLTKGDVVARMEKNYDQDVKSVDEILTEILTLADALAEGIIRQFPEKFAA